MKLHGLSCSTRPNVITTEHRWHNIRYNLCAIQLLYMQQGKILLRKLWFLKISLSLSVSVSDCAVVWYRKDFLHHTTTEFKYLYFKFYTHNGVKSILFIELNCYQLGCLGTVLACTPSCHLCKLVPTHACSCFLYLHRSTIVLYFCLYPSSVQAHHALSHHLFIVHFISISWSTYTLSWILW